MPFPSPGDLPDPGMEHGTPALQADALLSEPPGKPQDELFLIREPVPFGIKKDNPPALLGSI